MKYIHEPEINGIFSATASTRTTTTQKSPAQSKPAVHVAPQRAPAGGQGAGDSARIQQLTQQVYQVPVSILHINML